MIQYVSDLHMEHGSAGEDMNFAKLVTPKAPVLVLAGDIGWPCEESYQKFMKYCAERWQLVFVITGNHEYYCGSTETSPSTMSMMETDECIKNLLGPYANVIFLQNQSVFIGKISGVWQTTDRGSASYQVMGCTLWSDVPENMLDIARMTCNDYKRIKRFSPERSSVFHQTTRDWLLGQLQRATVPVIVISHHAPSYGCIGDKYVGNPLNFNYANDLEYLFEIYPIIKYWFYGHTHDAKQFQIKDTILGCNPYGYGHEWGKTGHKQQVVLPLSD